MASVVTSKLKAVTGRLTGLLNIKDKKSRRLSLLLMSALFIIGASALAYGSIVVEQPLQVITGGPGSVPSTAAPIGYATGTIFLLLALGVTVSIAVLSFAREAYRHLKSPDEEQTPGSVEVSSIDHEWEEAPKKGESEDSSKDA